MDALEEGYIVSVAFIDVSVGLDTVPYSAKIDFLHGENYFGPLK